MSTPTAPPTGAPDRWSLWASHLTAAAVPMLLLVGWSHLRFGFTWTHGAWSFETVSPILLGVAILASSLFACGGALRPSTETEVALKHLIPLGATTVLTAFAGMPLWFRLDSSPVLMADLGMTLTSYAVMLVGYWVLAAGFSAAARR